jgi:hypothetical protein
MIEQRKNKIIKKNLSFWALNFQVFRFSACPMVNLRIGEGGAWTLVLRGLAVWSLVAPEVKSNILCTCTQTKTKHLIPPTIFVGKTCPLAHTRKPRKPLPHISNLSIPIALFKHCLSKVFIVFPLIPNSCIIHQVIHQVGQMESHSYS